MERWRRLTNGYNGGMCIWITVEIHSHAICWYVQARVNVPGLSERTLRRSISASGVTLTPEIQVSNNLYRCYSMILSMHATCLIQRIGCPGVTYP